MFICVFCSFVFETRPYKISPADGSRSSASAQSGIDTFLVNTHNEHLF